MADLDDTRWMFTGDVHAMLRDTSAFRDARVQESVRLPGQPTTEQTLDVQQQFAGDLVGNHDNRYDLAGIRPAP